MRSDLEAGLRRRFDVREERFDHGSFGAELILPVASDELIDVSEFNVDDRLPYWAELWPSARSLARRILDADKLAPRAIELGCGVGLPSLALRSRAVDVLATDYYEEALDFTRANAARNRLPPLEVRELDWRSPDPEFTGFPLVVATDVLYEARNVDALLGIILHVTAPGGEVWIADPRRTYFEPFLLKIRALGWKLEADEEVEELAAAPDSYSRIRIVTLRAPAAR